MGSVVTGPDDRPEVRIAFIMPDGSIETTGQETFGYYETLPQIGDVIVEPSTLDDQPEAVVVVGRQMIKTLGEPTHWWLIVRPATEGYWREVYQLDQETNQAFAEMRNERSREFLGNFLEDNAERKQRRRKASIARAGSRNDRQTEAGE